MSLRRFWFLGFGSALLVTGLGGCHEPSRAQLNSVAPAPSAPPEAPVTTGSTAPVASARSAAAPGSASDNTSQSAPEASARPPLDAAVGSAAAGAPPSTNLEGDAAPILLDAHGKALAQTEQRPTLDSVSFQKRVALVAHAIISGDAEPALAAFFPLVAYQQVKDVDKPERDYKFRLLANFKRDVLEYHRALGAAAAETKFEGVTVSEKDAKWMAPGSEGNKVGYFRVLRSRLRFALPTGRTRDFELTSMISWRGEWYVVHLHGFK